MMPMLVVGSKFPVGSSAIDISNPEPPAAGRLLLAGAAAPRRHRGPPCRPGPTSGHVSYSIIRDGLIYVVDIGNGLYVLRYTGPQHREVDRTKYLEGNSNRGDPVNDN